MKRFLAITLISAVVVWLGAGCKSVRSSPKEIDVSIFGIGMEIEFYEPTPPPDAFGTVPIQATPTSWPKLMPRQVTHKKDVFSIN